MGDHMKISELIVFLQSRLSTLNNARASAVAMGQIDRIAYLDSEIAETETTLAQLRSI